MANIYLELTEALNRGGPIVALASGQAVVFCRIAIMSKAPLDVRWLAGGWSSHFEFSDRGRRVRCDFMSRPPRVGPGDR